MKDIKLLAEQVWKIETSSASDKEKEEKEEKLFNIIEGCSLEELLEIDDYIYEHYNVYLGAL